MEIGVVWDLDDDPQGNVQHCAAHDVTKGEVEEVLDGWLFRNSTVSKSSGNPITFGRTAAGRFLAVIRKKVDDAPFTVRPITAFEPD